MAAQGRIPFETPTNLPTNQPLQPSTRGTQQQLQEAVVQAGGVDKSSKDLSIEQPAPGVGLQAEGLLPAFSTRQYSHLPTPQSPNNFGRYIPDHLYTPESPIQHGSSTSNQSATAATLGQRLAAQSRPVEETPRPQSGSQQCMTPESSPFVSRNTPPRYGNLATPQYNTPNQSNDFITPKATTSSVKLESPILTPTPALAPAPHISSPISSSSDQPSHSSRLSSPFMAKLSIADRNARSRNSNHSGLQSNSPDPPRPIQFDDVFSSTITTPPLAQGDVSSMSTPPISPPPQASTSADATASAGGEMERIRQARMEEQLALFRDAENRRPDYLTRTKRTLSEADPSALDDDEGAHERDRGPTVGIMESPNKGRRLKLFQETSEESFEESLMAGGYGRYRTADWVRQPQPVSLPSGGIAGPSNIINLLEEVEEAPLTEKEIRKRKRLAAFRSEHSTGRGSNNRLFPVELEGQGRVLVDIPNEEHIVPGTPELSPSKRRGGNRRKKKAPESTSKDKKGITGLTSASEELLEKPNWPDSEFPWRLRTEEREELAKAEEEERMRWIERFLDRDSDEDEDEEAQPRSTTGEDEQEVLPPAKWGAIYEDDVDRPLPVRLGRGKMVPLLAHPEDTRKVNVRKRTVFPSDPADARAALLAKKSVRALSYRQQRRRRELDDDSDDEVVCICNGKDDGRELVQCDGCQTWYHLQCIGIKNIAELGREEDPWFCNNCVWRSRSPSNEPEVVPVAYKEPTFVPTEDEPRVNRSYDAPFFQSTLQDSPTWTAPPRVPKTPTRNGRQTSSDFDSGLSSSPSWIGSSRHGPSTPQHHPQGARVYANTTPGQLDGYGQNYDESPFDPTSTPSRGIRFPASFATPKNNPWSMRASGLFQTPSKTSVRGPSVRSFGGPGSLSSALDDSGGGYGASLGYDPLGRTPSYDESPIRRSKIADGPRAQREFGSPVMSRLMGSLGSSSLEESPVMRSKDKEDRGDR